MTVYQEREAQRTILLQSADQGATWTPVFDPTNANPTTRSVEVAVTDPNGDPVATGDGIAYFRVPSLLDGYTLSVVAAAVTTASSSGPLTIQVRNVTDTVDMLSTRITIEVSETDSLTATVQPVINEAADLVAVSDQLAIDVDAAGTGAKGLIVSLTFTLV